MLSAYYEQFSQKSSTHENRMTYVRGQMLWKIGLYRNIDLILS